MPASFSSSDDVVGLEVERAADAEDDREDRPDEHGEEIVDARAAAAQVIEPLGVERDRDDRPMNGSIRRYCSSGG